MNIAGLSPALPHHHNHDIESLFPTWVGSSTSMTSQPASQSPRLMDALVEWFRATNRQIVWRSPDTSPWGVLLSEVMSQQTQVSRVEPLWLEWMQRWPSPAALAAAPTAEVLRAWANLGYPRRALRLQEAAKAICERHQGQVPETVEELLALPGIGDYTARAVAAFGLGQNVPVVDTNVRRVYARLVKGQFHPGNPRKRDLAEVASLLSTTDHDGPTVSTALMDLGALVCLTEPRCESDLGLCPIHEWCTWHRNGRVRTKKTVRTQPRFAGSDRQVRGKIMARLRQGSATRAEISSLWPDESQLERALQSLLQDGLATQDSSNQFSLPG